MRAQTVFLLSPANCAGKRAQMLINERAMFDLAKQVRTDAGAPLGDIFSFLSGLYFRGKVSYARHFARPKSDASRVLVITGGRGLLPADTLVNLSDLNQFAQVAIDLQNRQYRAPFERDALLLNEKWPKARVVLLGSIATNKYTEVLLSVFGERLVFPREFVGRGDMSRGGLMLRCIDENRELEYISVAGAVRHGVRPAKLEKRKPLINTNVH